MLYLPRSRRRRSSASISGRNYSFRRTSTIEGLESRYALDSAIGDFLRLDVNGNAFDLTAITNSSWQTYGEISGDPDGVDWMDGNVLAHSEHSVRVNTENGEAVLAAEAIVESLTPIGASTKAPSISSAFSLVTTAAGGADMIGNAAFDGAATYFWDDPDDGLTSQFFHGCLFVSAAGLSTGSGNAFGEAIATNYVGIAINNNAAGWLGVVWESELNTYVVSGFIPGYNNDQEFEYASGSAYHEFTLPIPQDAIVTFVTDGPHAGGVSAWADTGGEWTSHAASAGAAWGYMTGTAGGLADGDVNGDGDVNEGDLDVIFGNIDHFNISAGGGGGGNFTRPATGLDGDLNNDGIVTAADIEAWLLHAPSNFFLVTNEVDEDDNIYSFNDLSLREALELADATGGGDVIRFAPWVEEINLALGQLEIDTGNEVHIKGTGADKLAINAGGASRVFLVDAGLSATISGMTITGGNSFGAGGGGIAVDGDLTLDSVVVHGNQAGNGGGGVYVSTTGFLTVNSSTFHTNNAGANKSGGAIGGQFGEGQVLGVSNSTFFNNVAGAGGAIKIQANNGGTDSKIDIYNSTFSGNVATDSGGAISVQSFGASPGWAASTVEMTILNCTITDNDAQGTVAGGIINVFPSRQLIAIHNSILAQNTAANTSYPESWGSLGGSLHNPSSHNLIGAGSSGVHRPGITHASNMAGSI